jgi:hydroxymethylbilane synthase
LEWRYFAAAGLERINLKPQNYINLDWMIPLHKEQCLLSMQNSFAVDALSHLNDIETEIVTYIERQFLKTLEGGCTAPIGAARYNEEDTIHFQGVCFRLTEKRKLKWIR